MKKTILLLLIFIATYSTAQQRAIDSLLGILSKHQAVDSSRVAIWIKLSDASTGDAEKAFQYADSAISLAKKLNDSQKQASAYLSGGYALSNLGDDSAAISYFNRAIEFYSATDDKAALGSAYKKIAISLSQQSQYVIALNYLDRAMIIFEELKDTLKMGHTYNSIGVNYMQMGNYTVAIENFLRAQKIYEKYDSTFLGQPFTNMGIVYTRINSPEKALSYLMQAVKFYRLNSNLKGEADAYMSIANLYDSMDSLQRAIDYYTRSLNMSKELNYQRGIAANMVNIAGIHIQLNNYKDALSNLQNAIAFYERIGDYTNVAITYNMIGSIFREAPSSFINQLRLKTSNRYSEALHYHQISLTNARMANNGSQVFYAYEEISNTYEKMNDFKNALLFHKLFIAARDSVLNTQNAENIARQQMNYEFDKKEALANAEHNKEKAIAQEEIKSQKIIKNAVMGGAGVFVFSAAFSFVFYKRRSDAEKEKVESDFRAQVSDTEMKALRAQMNPHFIFNSLNSISDYINRNDIKTADNYLAKFAKLMRQILENSEQKEVTLADDLMVLENYMQLEAMRLQNKFSYSIIVDEAIDQNNTMIPPLILQPFVENSIWHGIAGKQGEGKISIRIMKEGDMINCMVEDNGVGRTSAALKNINEKKSLGMKITQSRIDILNRIRKTSGEIKLSDLAEGLRVEVSLPFIPNY